MGAILDLPSPEWFGDYDPQVTVHIIDSSRPQNLATLFGAGENGDRIIIWDDGGAEKLEQEKTAFEEIMVGGLHFVFCFGFVGFNGMFANRYIGLQLYPEPDSDEDSDERSDGGPSGDEDEDGDVDVDGDGEGYGEDGRKRRSVGGPGQGDRKRRRTEEVHLFGSPPSS